MKDLPLHTGLPVPIAFFHFCFSSSLADLQIRLAPFYVEFCFSTVGGQPLQDGEPRTNIYIYISGN